MNENTRLFRVEHNGDTLILSPRSNLSELELSALEDVVRDVSQHFDSHGFCHLLIDFADTDYFGSTALGLFVKFWKRVRTIGGKMALCNASPHEQEILELTQLNNLWPVFPNRDEAVRFLQAE